MRCDSATYILSLERYANLSPEPVCWISGPDAEESISYCPSCAANKAGGQSVVVCAGSAVEDDSCCYCDSCGKLLNYTLTNAGVLAELAHFATRRFRRHPAKTEAYEIARIVAAAPHNPEALNLARRALAAIHRNVTHA